MIIAISVLFFFAVTFFIFSLLSSIQITKRKKRIKRGVSKEELLEIKAKEYEENFIFISSDKINTQRKSTTVALACFGAVGFLSGIVQGIVLMVALGVVGHILPDIMMQQQIKKRRKSFDRQVLDFLETTSNGLKAGLSFVQSLESAAIQLPDPMGQELNYTLRQVRLGKNLDDALIEMSERMESQNYNLVISAVSVTRQLGGNLPEIFATISETIRDRETMEGKVTALTAQGKMQAMLMGAMPFFLMLGVYFLDRKTIMPLFTTTIGLILLGVMLILNITGFLFIKKIVNVEI